MKVEISGNCFHIEKISFHPGTDHEDKVLVLLMVHVTFLINAASILLRLCRELNVTFCSDIQE